MLPSPAAPRPGARRPRPRAPRARIWPGVLVVALGVGAGGGHAANPNHIGVGSASSGFLFTGEPDLPAGGRFDLSTTTWLTSAPLTCRGNQPGSVSTPVRGTLGGGLDATWAVADLLAISLAVPLAVQDVVHTRATPLCPADDEIERWVVGVYDPALRVRLVPFPWRADRRYAFAFEAGAQVPVMRLLGMALAPTPVSLLYPPGVTELFGDDWGALYVLANPGVRTGALEVVGEVGLSLRPRSAVLGQMFGSELRAGVGARLQLLWPGLFALVDVTSRLSAPTGPLAAALSSSAFSAPTEVMVGLHKSLYPLTFTVGAGGAVLPGYGAPSVRVMVTMSYEGRSDRSRRSRPLFDLGDWGPRVWDWLTAAWPRTEGDDESRGHGRPAKPRRCPEPGSAEDELFFDPSCEDDVKDGPEDLFDPERDFAELEKLMCPAVPPEVEERLVLRLPLRFAFDADELDEGERARLARDLATLPEGARIVEVLVIGHADQVGGAAYNDALSTRRAQHVADVLADRLAAAGLPSPSFVVLARGEEDPLLEVPPAPDGVAANRRVEVVIRYLPPERPAAPPDAVHEPPAEQDEESPEDAPGPDDDSLPALSPDAGLPDEALRRDGPEAPR